MSKEINQSSSLKIARSKAEARNDLPTQTGQLRPSERRFTDAIQNLGFGRFESLRIVRGELLLDPWPITIRNVKFGAVEHIGVEALPPEFELKKQVSEFFEYVRTVDFGAIRCLEIRHGLPFSIEIELRARCSGVLFRG